jgi:hypothetical protein
MAIVIVHVRGRESDWCIQTARCALLVRESEGMSIFQAGLWDKIQGNMNRFEALTGKPLIGNDFDD